MAEGDSTPQLARAAAATLAIVADVGLWRDGDRGGTVISTSVGLRQVVK